MTDKNMSSVDSTDRDGVGQTNMRGETPTEAFETAVVEAFAPLLREAVHGRSVSETEARERLERQLAGRGFTVDSDGMENEESNNE